MQGSGKEERMETEERIHKLEKTTIELGKRVQQQRGTSAALLIIMSLNLILQVAILLLRLWQLG